MRYIATLVLGLLVMGPAIADDDCTDLIRHGIYNYFQQSSRSSNYSATQSEICTQYNKLQTERKSGNIGASYGLFSGSASLSAEQLERIGSSMCASSAASAKGDALAEVASTVISPEALAAYQQCKALGNLGLKFESSFNDDDQGTKRLAASIKTICINWKVGRNTKT
jgi:hypothetical protein